MSRVLGVDTGAARVGLAISDPDRRVATPLQTIPAGEGLAERIAAEAASQGCDTVVVGLPRGLAGHDTASTELARALATALERQGLRVELWDERLSTVEADRAMVASGGGARRRREQRDQVAAAIILQGWLDGAASPRPRGGRGEA